jgi:hypothetical protein
MKVTPPNPLSKKKDKATRTKFDIVLTPDEFHFIIAALNNTLLEIAEKQESKQEEVFSHIRDMLQGVQQEIQSRCTFSIAPLPSGTLELGDEPAQVHQIVNVVEAQL